MSKPSIGSAVTPATENEKKQIVELTKLPPDSKESIYSLVFLEQPKEQQNEQ